MKCFLDTNIFIRYLTGDDEVKSPQCFALMQKISQGEIEAYITESILTEICYVLSAKNLPYKLSNKEIYERLVPILHLENLKIANKASYLEALQLFSSHANLDIEDAITIAQMKTAQAEILFSFDKDFDSISDIRRDEL